MMNQMKKKEESQEEDKPLVEEKVEFHQLSSPTVGKKHDWIQKGPDLICTSCESAHGIRIGVNKRLKGFDENGQMIIENVN